MFPHVSTGIARATYRPLGRRSRRTTTSAIAAGTMAIALLAGDGNFANAAEYSSRTAQEEHACAFVMGLHEPGDLYDTCMRSLDKTLSELHKVRLASTSRNDCAKRGFEPGTPGFADCLVRAEQPATDVGGHAAAVAVR